MTGGDRSGYTLHLFDGTGDVQTLVLTRDGAKAVAIALMGSLVPPGDRDSEAADHIAATLDGLLKDRPDGA